MAHAGRYHVRVTTAMDGLAHWVPPHSHHRWCDRLPIAGLNAERTGEWAFVTCIACAMRGTRKYWR